MNKNLMAASCSDYAEKLATVLSEHSWSDVENVINILYAAWQTGRQLFICGNGGSAGNAIHLANDFLYGVGCHTGKGIRVEALTSNPSVLTCLANDISYDDIFSQQLKVKAMSGDVLIVLSGSGNSKNVVRALEIGNALSMITIAITGYSGGYCRQLAQQVVHFPVDDMQIAEDLQLVVGHMCMQVLKAKSVAVSK